MRSADDAGILSEEVLEENYDLGTIDRGAGYFHDGRAQLITNGPGRVAAVVEGSGNNTYVTRVSWRSLESGGVVVEDTCTCPLGGFCKHAVAAILTARADADHGAPLDGPPTWRQLLDGLDTPESSEHGRMGAPLALQFTVSAPSTSPSGATGSATAQLAVRPLRMGKRERWIKSGASWRDLAYAGGPRDLDLAQVAALRALWNASPRRSYHPDTGPLTLGRFGSDLWLHLRHAADTGVVFVDHTGEDPVELHAEPAHVVVDLTASADGDATLVTSLAWATGDPLGDAEARVGLLGTPPHGVFVESASGTVSLARLETPLVPAILRMLEAPPLHVPAGEVPDLLDHYQPLLARAARFGSSDGSVTITARRFDGLRVLVERHALDHAAVSWHARYVRGATVTHHRLRDPEPWRDLAAEATATAELAIPEALRGLLGDLVGRPADRHLEGVDAIRLFADAIPWLCSRPGVEVQIVEVSDTALPELREATADPLVELSVRDGEAQRGQTDWFDLAVQVSVDGETVPFAALFAALNREEPVLVLASGTWIRLDRPEFARLRDLIAEARGLTPSGADDVGVDDEPIPINRFQLSLFEELAALGVVRDQSERWAASVARLADLTEPGPVATPATLKADLRPYQEAGFSWLHFIRAHELGGILADDMGLGKTVQVLALCASILDERPDARFLVVAPTSVVGNWQREAERFVPSMATTTITGTAARRGATIAEKVRDASLVVTSYTLFRLEFDDYADLEWDLLLLDEAQFVKNHQGKTYRAVRELPATSKIAITGTPLENSLMDLWALLSIVAPGLYPDPQRFSRVYRKPIEKGDAPELLARLHRRIAPLLRRRTKDAVLTELPPKIEQVIEVDLSPRHRRLYQTHLQRERAKVLGLVDDVQRNRFVIFKSLTLLRQLSLDPALVDDAAEGVGSAKLDRLVDDVTQVVAEGHRALVFSQFTRFLRRAEDRLGDAGVATVYLDGRTRHRDQIIDTFKSGAAPVFLISLKAGGVGLNLTEADYCFILDPWWNPATENQAVDRAHRIGQDDPVVVYRYVSTGTIEEKVMELKARKAALFADVVDADGSLAGALTAEDLRGLFESG